MPKIDKWFTVATAGDTVDGRVIEEQWLRDMAETYSVDFYQAVIDADHNLEWYGSFGQVEELRIGEKVGRVALQAKINANHRLLEMNKNGQRLFFSIWPKENFSDTGKTYLYRLAVTDNPASIGTDKMKFSCGEKPVLGTPHLFEYEQPGTSNEPETKIPPPPPPPAGAVPTEESLFSVLRNFFTGKPEKETDNNTPDDQPQDDDTMNEEQFAAFMQQQKDAAADQLAAIKDLGEKFSATDNDGTPGDDNTDTGNEETADTVSVEKFNTLQEELDALKTKFAAALEEQPGTPQGDHDGADGADEGKQFQSAVC